MKKSIVTLAFIMALVPWFGIFEDWKKVLISLSGILIVVLVLIPRKEKSSRRTDQAGVYYMENDPQNKEKEQPTNEDKETIS